MKLLLYSILLALTLPPARAGEEYTLLVLGDSLSAAYGLDPRQSWVNLLQRRLDQVGGHWQVVNAGISGDTTAGGLARLPQLLERHRPHLVIIELGSNDGLRGLAFTQLRTNLQRLIQQARTAGAKVLLIGARVPPNYGEAYATAFHQIFHQVAQAEAVPLVPFLLEGVARNRSLMQADGYHPTAAAQPHLLDTVWPRLQPLLADIAQQ